MRISNCSPCADVLCDLCLDFDTLICSQCIPNASSVVTCTCNQGYYLNSLTRSCDLCDFTCLACSSTKACTSCKPYAALIEHICVCQVGYYGAADDCKSCSWGCQVCSNNESCERCLLGYFNVEGICSLHCPANYSEDQTYWICLPLPNPFTGVSVSGEVDENNTVSLNFSQPVQPQLTLDALALSLTDTDAHTYIFSTSMSERVANQTYHITLTLAAAYLSENNELSVVFLDPAKYMDMYGNHLLNSSLSLTLHPQGLESTPNKTVEVQEATATTLASSTVTGLVVGLVAGNPASLFTLVNSVQMLTYLPLSTIPLPDELKKQLIGLNLQLFISNPVAKYLSANTEGDSSTPEFAQDYGFTAPSFLSNTGNILVTTVLNLGVYLVLLTLSKACRRNPHIRKGLEGYHWRNVGMHWILSYLDLSIAAYLQLLRVTPTQLSFTSVKSNTYISSGGRSGCGQYPFSLLVVVFVYSRSLCHSFQ